MSTTPPNEHNPDLVELLREPTFETLHANTEFSYLAWIMVYLDTAGLLTQVAPTAAIQNYDLMASEAHTGRTSILRCNSAG